MFNDYRIDRQRTVEFLRANGSFLRTVGNSNELTENMTLLLPDRVYGFALRSRSWHLLQVDKIRSLEPQNNGFESLVLPPGVARLVESLVKNMPSTAGGDFKFEHDVDILHGKGRGLIMLLHGAPGVGKTSTAECVADYTHRPLLSITCGDLGETPMEVEHNLEQNFSLAQRWDCVLLVSQNSILIASFARPILAIV